MPGYVQTMDDFLGIYLRDQFALAVGMRELARRAERSNPDGDLGAAVRRVAAGIGADVDALAAILHRVSVRPNPVKNAIAVAAERAGRLKLNGRLRQYSPLSRVVELDGLVLGIEAKKLMWATLRDAAGLAETLPDVDFGALLARADQQRADLEPFRLQAGTDAFRTPDGIVTS